MTALDDFVAQYERPLRRVVIPIYFGLAIVAEQALVDRHPSLAAELDRLESALGKDALLELAEQTRLRALVHQRKEVGRRETLLEASAVRYLALLKRTLLDEVYIENEVRLQYLADCITKNRPVDETQLRDPVRYLKQQTAGLESVRATGALGDAAGTGASFLPYTDMGRARLDHLEHALDVIRREDISGDLVDCSTGRGGGGIFMRGYLDAYQVPDRLVWVVDRFRVHARGAGSLDLGTDLNQVRDAFARFDVFDDRVRFVQGDYGETLKGTATGAIALLRIGADSDDAGAILERLYPRLAAGGFVVVDDYASPACRARVDEYRAARGLTEPLDRIDASAVSWRKATSAPGAAPRAVEPRSRQTTVDLSVVVVFYNMRREAARTLHSLSRAYQEGLDGVAYEVIVVENGSAPDQKLGADYVTSFGPEFRYVDLDDAARPSPVYALNHGAALATGNAVAFMIDGAHVLTPGVLRNGLLGLSAYEPSVVVTQQWYVGPGQQGDEMRTGYDQAFEDKLFDRIGWPSDGYRLFEIGHFIGDRDWLDGLWESNCIFATRALLDQVGVFDEAFSVAGGEYANLDFYERLVANPRTTMVSILGEGSFHQVHGGTTTNQLDTDGRRARIVSYAERYKDLRGRNYKGPGKTIHYIGSMRASALRTRARRMTGTAFRDARVDADATVSVPMPDQLRDEFIDAFWHTQAWRGTEWLGVTVERPASDLVAYQTVVARTRPDWIVVTGPRS
ncbi:MAG TPA: TylF/MycF/NovP-related O-methyltransferase, partial [Acidimicrobiia bacterium]|nr:TylF/MycF/NovP-related O-methyltransferase [Acidimicrobiia bacterium]